MTPVSRKDGSNSNTNVHRRLFTNDVAIDSSEEFDKSSSPNVNSSSKLLKPVKYVNGVAVVNGRTRSLVEKFEKSEKVETGECQKPSTDNVTATTVESRPINVVSCAIIPEAATSPRSDIVPGEQSVTLKTPDRESSPELETKSAPVTVKTSPKMLREKAKASLMQRPIGSRRVMSEKARSPPMAVTRRFRAASETIPERSRTRISRLPAVPRHDTYTQITIEKPKFSPLPVSFSLRNIRYR